MRIFRVIVAFYVLICAMSPVVTAFAVLPPVVATIPSAAREQRMRQAECSGLATRRRRRRRTTTTRLQESEDQQPDYETEETLLKIHLAITRTDISLDDAKQTVVKYCQSFPFAAVLPVQPLQYLPAHDKDGVPDGVDLSFLRKKTDMKSGKDGGIRFFVTAAVPGQDNGLEVTAKRNSIGQTIRKIHAERLVVTSFVAGFTGEEPEKYGKVPLETVQVTSLFHKWM